MNVVTPARESAYYSASCYRSILERIGVVFSFTQGVSMRPLIFTGACYVAIVPVDEPQIGDILLFEQIRRGSTACVLHRLVAIDGDVYVTRGDNCYMHECITQADIIGRVENIYWHTVRRSSWNPLLWLPRLCSAKRENNTLVLTVHDRGYLRYVRLWNALWPLRRVVFKMRWQAGRLYRKLRACK